MSGKSQNLLWDSLVGWSTCRPPWSHPYTTQTHVQKKRAATGLVPATLLLSFMDRRAPQVVSGTVTSTIHDNSTSSYGPRPGYPGAACPTVNSICYGTPTSTPDGPATDFSSTALWAVVIATLAAATFMGGLLFYTRRRKRIRTRQRIRALIWDVVHGVQAGTIEPVVLQRLIYGPDGISAHLQAPDLFEAWLPVTDQSAKLVNGPAGNDPKKWAEMYPLSMTPPYAPVYLPKDAPTRVQKQPPLQWPWHHPHAVDSARSHPAEPIPLQHVSKNEKRNDKGKESFKLYAERHVDTGVLISMPRPPPPNNDLNTPQLVINCPIELGSTSLMLQDNLLDPAIPPASRFADLTGPRVVDPLSSALARHTRGRYSPFNSRANHPLSSTGPSLTANTIVDTPHSQWAARRGLAGGTPAG